MVSLSPILKISQYCTGNWYHRPGNFIDPSGHFDIPNDYNIEEMCADCFNRKKFVVDLQPTFYVTNGIAMNVMLLSCLTLSSKKKMCLSGGCSVSDSFCYI